MSIEAFDVSLRLPTVTFKNTPGQSRPSNLIHMPRVQCPEQEMPFRVPRCAFAPIPYMLALAFLCANAWTAPLCLASPAGRWKTVDDKTGQIKSIVQIREQNGTLYGTIEKIFNPPVRNPLCIACTGALKNRPLLGLQILWGLHKDGTVWSGGQILDPETGKIYRCYLALEDGGRKLRVRGYIGFSIFGRTEYWLRVE
ncbi:MAG: DUF2147 domain-containing protein [Terracidiphilus sp.]